MCDVENLPQCKDHRSYLSTGFLVQLFLPMKSEFCKKFSFSYADTLNLERKPLALTKGNYFLL